VGGKNASLGEMVRNLTAAGVQVPDGFATTADTYRHFISDGGLAEMINAELAALDTDDVQQLAAVGLRMSLPSTTIARSRIGPSSVRARRRRSIGRGAADGAIRHRSVWGDVHHGHRVRLPRCRFHHLLLRSW
jgi:Pyruvate phosphate dikinase, AMP/ATP-binding domain